MDTEKLMELVSLLRENATNPRGARFDYKDFGTVLDPTAPMSCGTTACGLGLAALSGRFPELGFILPDGLCGRSLIKFTFNKEPTDPYEAGKLVFGLDYEQSFAVFGGKGQPSSVGYEGEMLLADRIEYLAKTGIAPMLGGGAMPLYGIGEDGHAVSLEAMPDWDKTLGRG